MAGDAALKFLAPQAWIGGQRGDRRGGQQGGQHGGEWARDVLLTVSPHGLWHGVQAEATAQQAEGAVRLQGAVLPGLPNTHSHAFQRAIAGLTERRHAGSGAADDFWSWRDRMYSAALRITPAQLEAIATQLYTELLAGGYTHVCEFHYLHNGPDGRPGADPADMALALVRAAETTGIGLTLLPTLYMRSGFDARGLREDQRRFASTPDSVLRIVDAVQAHVARAAVANGADVAGATAAGGPSRISVGVAIHSLRAVGPGALAELAAEARARGLPVHIHIAEQVQEVDDCIAHTGLRPIEWLLQSAAVDARWHLVHATHATPAELQGVAASGAGIVICPSTEANLGDGVFDLPAYAAAGGLWSIGSDSQIGRSWPEELRLLDYAQRLVLRQRNVAARVLAPGRAASSAAVMFDAALAGGSPAAGQPLGGLVAGQRADFCVVDTDSGSGTSSALLGLPPGHLLDALVFSSPTPAFSQVYVGGRQVLLPGTGAPVAARFVAAMHALWS